jgi:hypothetical protein
LDAGHNQARARGRSGAVAKGQDLVEVLSGVDVQDGEGELLGCEGFGGQVQEDGRVLAAGEEQDGSLALGHDFTQNKEGVGLENVEMVSGVRGGQGCGHDLLG